jgi:hypothetical protein
MAWPKAIPEICGNDLLNPNFNPEIVSIALFGPGVMNITV